jgi:N-acetylglutamate synthase-like GNAT family acetyltransferase
MMCLKNACDIQLRFVCDDGFLKERDFQNYDSTQVKEKKREALRRGEKKGKEFSFFRIIIA